MEDQSLTLRLLQPFDACPVTLPLDLLSMCSGINLLVPKATRVVVTHRLRDGLVGLLCELLIFEQECKFLEGSVGGFGEEEPDKDDLVDKEDAVYDKPLPLDVVEADRVDEGGEESSSTTPELEESNTTVTLHVGPYLDQVSYHELALMFT
jgi:hypothetical protein